MATGSGSGSNEDGAAWAQVLGRKLVRGAGDAGEYETVATAEALKGKHVGLYFSAHWCPPCRQFTPRLVDLFTKLTKSGTEWEVVFVSCDKDKAEFDAYFSGMPWLAIPFEDSRLRDELSTKFRVHGIPTLVMMSPDTTILSANARAAVGVDGHGVGFPWAGTSEPEGFPLPWMLLAILIFWVVSTFIVPKWK